MKKRDADIAICDLISHLQRQHAGICRRWFEDLRIGEIDAGKLEILAETPEQVLYLRSHCVSAFRDAAQSLTGRLITAEFATHDGTEVREPTPDKTDFAVDAPAAATHGSIVYLNGEYTFDNLVVGPCNRLANAACRAVSEAPGTAYNPLFLHGDVGLGKTHMLQAICHELLESNPAAHVIFLSCEAFVNQFIEAVEKGDLANFRYQYRHADLLVIDDIQFLIGHDRTQEEFFHTFNALYQINKQIVISGDAPPNKMKGIENRLVSRFNWGLVARLDPPCLETRNAILRKKMRAKGMQLPDDITMFVASETPSNARELEGVLNRIHGMSALEGRAPDAEMVRSALGQTMQHSLPAPRIQDIAAAASTRFGVKLSELQGKRRSRSIALPRQICMYLARQLTPHSLEEIGGYFGGRDHTTVLHAHRQITDRLRDDMELRGQVQGLERDLRQVSARMPISA
ncbi:MAG: chromosomal replication initiator protein DnaA [Phycisphaerales bacterium]|nr:chromosomal replication initiator protein DnaA [Phycisphaerales bacterium]